MSLNPFRRKSKTEQARERLGEAIDRLGDAVNEAEQLAETVPSRARRPLVALLLVFGGGALLYAWRRAARSEPDEVPVPTTVTPTAPAGPTDARLNDPALKAKVESILFADDEVPKEKLSIGVADGVVTLRGELETRHKPEQLTRTAAEIDGVRRVENLTTLA